MENNNEHKTIPIEVFSLEFAEIPEPKEVKTRSRDYISWGENNDYPEFLKKLYDNSATHQTIIDGIVGYVIGRGVKSQNPQLTEFFSRVNRYGHTINDVCELLALDIEIFGGCAVLVINSVAGGLSEIYHLDMARVRINEFENRVYFSKSWKSYMKEGEIKQYPEFLSAEAIGAPSSVYYFKGNKTRGYYPVPGYNGALKAIQVDCHIIETHLNDVENGFTPNTIINFNNGQPKTEEIKKEIEDTIKRKFSGRNGAKIMLVFNNGKENAATIDKIESDDTNEKFISLRKNIKDEIFTAHRVTSPALFGVKMEGSGFSKTEYFEAFKIFNETVIKRKQKTLITILTQIFERYYQNPTLTIEHFKIETDELQ